MVTIPKYSNNKALFTHDERLARYLSRTSRNEVVEPLNTSFLSKGLCGEEDDVGIKATHCHPLNTNQSAAAQGYWMTSLAQPHIRDQVE